MDSPRPRTQFGKAACAALMIPVVIVDCAAPTKKRATANTGKDEAVASPTRPTALMTVAPTTVTSDPIVLRREGNARAPTADPVPRKAKSPPRAPGPADSDSRATSGNRATTELPARASRLVRIIKPLNGPEYQL